MRNKKGKGRLRETNVGSIGADRHLDTTFGLQVVESSSLVSVLFREAFNHPYISFFYLLVNGCSVIYVIGERSEPLSRVFNDQPRDIYIYLYHGCYGNSHGIKVIYPA